MLRPRTPRPARTGGKSARAFRTISEAALELDVEAYVLRFWERKFRQISPLKRNGRRYYRPEDIELLRYIRGLLYEEGLTIKGAQRLLNAPGAPAEPEDAAVSPGPRPVEAEPSASPAPRAPVRPLPPETRIPAARRDDIERTLRDLERALELLRKTVGPS
jgi:DNA-binding transcriptional MerR regulator